MSDNLRPHELQHAKPPCPSPTSGIHSDSHPSSQPSHPLLSLLLLPPIPPSIKVFSNESTLHTRWPKYWSLSFLICTMDILLLIYSKMMFRQFSSVAQSCPTLCDPMNRSMPGLRVHHQLQEFTQIHVHRVSDAIQPSHPRSSPSPPAPNPSQYQSLFQ